MNYSLSVNGKQLLVEEIINKVKFFHQKHRGYAFMYTDSMVKLSIDDNLPKTIVKMHSSGSGKIVERQYTTAYVAFDKEGRNISFKFNKYFYETLNRMEVAFIFAHESLHVLLDHGRRGNVFLKSLPEDKRNNKILNIAMDVCINEILMREVFADDLYKMPIMDDMCNIANVFGSKGIVVEEGKNFEYYYHQIFEHIVQTEDDADGLYGEFTTFGDVVLDDNTISIMEEMLDDIIEKGGINDENVSEKIKNDKSENYGNGSGGSDVMVESKFKEMSMQEVVNLYVKPRNASKIDMKAPSKRKYNWCKDNRRTSYMNNSARDGIIFPNSEVTHKRKKKKVVIYADVSGSVANYTKEFFGMIEDIDIEDCDLEVYAWADNVSIATKKDKETYQWKNAGGGTNIYGVLKHYENNYSHERVDAIIVLTDGCYSDIDDYTFKNRDNMNSNNRWIFLMTEEHKSSAILEDSISVKMKGL